MRPVGPVPGVYRSRQPSHQANLARSPNIKPQRKMRVGQKVPTFPRDGRGEPSMQPSRDLHVVVSHRALRKGLRRSLQQAHLKGEASLPRGWDVALFFCNFLICILLCMVCPCIRAFGGITAAPRARSLVYWGLPGRTASRRCLIVECCRGP